GIMMQWVPNGQTQEEFRAHLRTFAAVYPNMVVIRGPGGYGAYMLGSDASIALTQDAIAEVLARPGILAEISSAYDSPESSIAGWQAAIDRLTWLTEPEARNYAGTGPLITDDRPLPEYFLLRRLAEPSRS
ncbi:MAG: hypothetical protein ACJ761_02780, partial [Chloroflexota bacterium]